MQQPEIKFQKLQPRARLPVYMSQLAAGMDICACLEESVPLEVGQRSLIATGLACAIPSGYEIQVRPRSGLAIKHGIALVNAPGTIDADYRGEIKIILINLGDQLFTVNDGERIAQLVVAPVCRAELSETDALEETPRGTGGFGHTGVKSS